MFELIKHKAAVLVDTFPLKGKPRPWVRMVGLLVGKGKMPSPIRPMELLTWGQNFSGLRFSEDGQLRLIPDEERLAAIANPAPPAGPWADLASR